MERESHPVAQGRSEREPRWSALWIDLARVVAEANVRAAVARHGAEIRYYATDSDKGLQCANGRSYSPREGG